jgi:hypothetical protein
MEPRVRAVGTEPATVKRDTMFLMRGHSWFLAVAAAVLCAGCDVNAVDPTDPGYKVQIRNDLSQGLSVGDSQEVISLRPGQSDVFSPGPERRARYVVTSRSGKRLGCLAVRLNGSSTVDAQTSEAQPC